MYLCFVLIVYILYLLYKLLKIKKEIKMVLADFQKQFDSLNTSLSSITKYVASLSLLTGGLSATDAATVLSGLTDIATKASSIVPVPIVPTPITGNTSVAIGSTITLDDATAGGTWASSDPTVATIDASGMVTGISTGTVTISYTFADATSVSYTITVA